MSQVFPRGVLTAFCVTLTAHNAGADIRLETDDVMSYVTDSRQVVVRSGSGLCWRTGFWTPAAAENIRAGEQAVGCLCDADVMAKGQCEQEQSRQHHCPFSYVADPVLKEKIPSEALFDFDSAHLTEAGRDGLQKALLRLRENFMVDITGIHRDMDSYENRRV